MTAKTQPESPQDNEHERRRRVVTRLARIEGQVRGIQGMISDNCSCEQVAQQLTAARRALDKAFYEMLACSLVSHVDASGDMEDVRASTNELARLLSKFG
jgi:DNA-binding FrmR family transcriptional regulator